MKILVKEIALTQGKVALIDDIDYPLVSQYKWFAVRNNTHWYAATHEPLTHRFITMHRLILDLKKGEICDHANNSGWDNRRCNIRKATISQNGMNRRKQLKSTDSKYKGVSLDKVTNRWVSRLMLHSKDVYIGRFLSEEDAARAYDKKAKELFGEYALFNFPADSQS